MNAFKLNVIEFPRAAPKLVLLHGLGGTHRYWQTGLEELKSKFHVILIDLLGFGESEKPWVNYTKSLHLAALKEHLACYDRFYLVGHSLGAILSIAYCAKSSEKCLGLFLISTPFFSGKNQAFRWLRRTPTGWLMTNMVTAIITCLVTRRVAGRFLPRLLKDFPTAVAEDLVKHTFMSSTTSLWQVVYHSNILFDLDKISQKIPCVWIHAIDDDTAPYETIKKLTTGRANCKLITLEYSAHHPWLWNNNACLSIIDDAIQ